MSIANPLLKVVLLLQAGWRGRAGVIIRELRI